MKFNIPFLVSIVLTVFFSAFSPLSANAKDYGDKNYVELRRVLVANPYEENISAKNPEQGFIAKHTTQMEFSLALLIIAVGLVASERYHSNQATDEVEEI